MNKDNNFSKTITDEQVDQLIGQARGRFGTSMVESILKQANNPANAIKEALCNSADAGATKISVEMTNKEVQVDGTDIVLKVRLVISDNGSGLSREDYFKRWIALGFDGDAEEHHNEEQVKRFQVGRGQYIWIFKKVLVLSRNIQSYIDRDVFVKNFFVNPFPNDKYYEEEVFNGFQLSMEAENFTDDQLFDHIQQALQEVQMLLYRKKIKVDVNGEPYNYVDDNTKSVLKHVTKGNNVDYHFSTRNPSLRIFTRQGVEVEGAGRKLHQQLGVKGNVFLNVEVELDLARTTISETDEYRNAIKEVRNAAINYLEGKTYFSEAEKKAMRDMIARDSNLVKRLGDKAVFQTVQDKWVSYDDIKNANTVALLDGGRDAAGVEEMLRKGGKGFVLKNSALSWIEERFVKGLDIIFGEKAEKMEREYKERFSQHKHYDIKDTREWLKSPKHVRAIAIAHLFNKNMKLRNTSNREIRLYEKEGFGGETDGHLTIWLNAKSTLSIGNKRASAGQIMRTLCHEYGHDEDNTGDEHGHTSYFWEGVQTIEDDNHDLMWKEMIGFVQGGSDRKRSKFPELDWDTLAEEWFIETFEEPLLPVKVACYDCEEAFVANETNERGQLVCPHCEEANDIDCHSCNSTLEKTELWRCPDCDNLVCPTCRLEGKCPYCYGYVFDCPDCDYETQVTDKEDSSCANCGNGKTKYKGLRKDEN
jgi:hypothetical protein